MERGTDGGGSARGSEGLRGKRQICVERCHYVNFCVHLRVVGVKTLNYTVEWRHFECAVNCG